MMNSAVQVETGAQIASPVLALRWIRIVPVAMVMYAIAFIDRTNISMALPRISKDLHLDPQQAGNVAGIFFWGFLSLQVLGGHLAKHWSAKKFVSFMAIIWGFFAVGCGLARTYHELLLLRLFLGIAESGVFPAILILVSHWFSRAERARANAFFLLCLPGAIVASSPLRGWMLDHWSWRVVMVAEGCLPFLWLPVWLLFIRDHPSDASWLSSAERGPLVETLRREAAELERSKGSKSVSYLRDLFRLQTFLLVGVYFCFTSGQYGLLFWLPSAIEKFRKLSSLSTGILYTLPFIVGAISLQIIARHSDKTRERRIHAAGAMLFGGCCLLLAAATISSSLLVAFAFIALSGVGAYGPMGPLWSIPTETLPARIVGSVMGFVNAVGNLGAYFAPLIVGYINKRTGSFLGGFTYLGAMTVAGAGLTLLLRTTPAALETAKTEGHY